MKKRQYWSFTIISFIIFLFFIPLQTNAKEQDSIQTVTEMNEIMTAKTAIDVKKTPAENDEIIFSYDKNANILVVGETKSGWYQVSFQDKTGFVPKSMLEEQKDINGIDEEFQFEKDESKMVVEEIERYRVEARRSKIWGTVIILLIIGIFATGIISTIKNDKDGEAKTKSNLKVNKTVEVKTMIKEKTNKVTAEHKNEVLETDISQPLIKKKGFFIKDNINEKKNNNMKAKEAEINIIDLDEE